MGQSAAEKPLKAAVVHESGTKRIANVRFTIIRITTVFLHQEIYQVKDLGFSTKMA